MTAIKDKIQRIFFLLYCLLWQVPMEVLADDNNEAAEELKKIITNTSGTGLLDILEKAGWVIIIFGIGKMIFAFKDDNPDGKAQGSMILLAGFFIVSLRFTLRKLWLDSPV